MTENEFDSSRDRVHNLFDYGTASAGLDSVYLASSKDTTNYKMRRLLSFKKEKKSYQDNVSKPQTLL